MLLWSRFAVRFENRLLERFASIPSFVFNEAMQRVQVLPRLIVGSVPRPVEDIETLLREWGITAVLNLQTDDDMLSVSVD
jgi:hypothetical protein